MNIFESLENLSEGLLSDLIPMIEVFLQEGRARDYDKELQELGNLNLTPEEMRTAKEKILKAKAKSERDRIYRAANLERIRARENAYYHNNKAKVSAARKVRYQDNKEEILSKQKVFRTEHRDERSARRREQYQQNKDALNAKQRERYAKRKAANNSTNSEDI